MGRKLHHCSGCIRLTECKKAYWGGSDNCELYVRDNCCQCHKCIRFGEACQESGIIRCEFQPRINEDQIKRMYMEEEKGDLGEVQQDD